MFYLSGFRNSGKSLSELLGGEMVKLEVDVILISTNTTA